MDAAKRELEKFREAFTEMPTAGPPTALSPSAPPVGASGASGSSADPGPRVDPIAERDP